ncbi:S26 family signal peptidase [Streptomyces sp. NBC_01260]|uniref:S26 family signal peptidase n=1 Tax=unclassified Streptomyces TaxID=2593676 RepID=UPI000F4A6037|nr:MULTISPECIES: S26 family signal peptidase [unclassified Streptomyces]MCX4774952.1 S26 family signal peptidase [Streptomyces sp. NBC_01285]ROQ78396.1 peptidase S24-like protein [Streptomyces sp. CEV 2-1]
MKRGLERRCSAADRFGEPRAPRARRALVLGAVVLWCGAPALAAVSACAWALLCGVAALAFSLGLVATALLARSMVAVTVRGASMEPLYRDGDRVLVRRRRNPGVGEVVVVEQPMPDGSWSPASPRACAPTTVPPSHGTWVIKRVVAVPGDPVPRDLVPSLARVPETRVPAGRLVVLGDNPQASADSRQAGYFPGDRVFGVALRLRARYGASPAVPGK